MSYKSKLDEIFDAPLGIKTFKEAVAPAAPTTQPAPKTSPSKAPAPFNPGPKRDPLKPKRRNMDEPARASA